MATSPPPTPTPAPPATRADDDEAHDDEAPDLDAILMEVAYDGEAFCGFAKQKTGRTVQGALIDAVRSLDAAVVDVRGASRTDSGVHARGQLVAFDPRRAMPARAWQAELNRRLPVDLVIRSAREVPAGFIPRFESHGKRYTYLVKPMSIRDPLERRRAWTFPFAVDAERAARELSAIVGTHDFRAFRKAADERTETVRQMVRADLTSDGPLLEITIEGTGFMYNMVRIIVGTIIEVGAGRRREGALERAIVSGNRRDLGITAPPHGLCLERVFLPSDDDLPTSWSKVGKKLFAPRVGCPKGAVKLRAPESDP